MRMVFMPVHTHRYIKSMQRYDFFLIYANFFLFLLRFGKFLILFAYLKKRCIFVPLIEKGDSYES